jgi:aldehyde dehydrogenase (NAD+)
MGIHHTDDQNERSKFITQQCLDLARIIKEKKPELTALLSTYESHETIADELWRSVDCFEAIAKNPQHIPYGTVDMMCTFFPVNLPLYSLTVFAIVPGFMSKELFVRPPLLMDAIIREVADILELPTRMPQLKFINMERDLFREAYVSISDVILFTGRYENAMIIEESCKPDSLFIYNGAGVNPVVVTATADIPLAVRKTIEMRVFNSGQDCAGSDGVLVHEEIADDFTNTLLLELQKVKVGDYSDPEVRVGSLVKVDHVPVVKDFFATNKEQIIFGGTIDDTRKLVYPTVIKKDIRAIDYMTYAEFFAPVFFVVTYHTDTDLKKFFSEEKYTDRAMFVSFFSKNPPPFDIPNTVVLQNKIVNDVERGAEPYGGYGPKANYISYNGAHESHPILITDEICKYIKKLSIQ